MDKPMYAIMNKSSQHFLNIRINDSENNILWNSHKEKRFWITGIIEQAQAQCDLILNSIVVEIKKREE